MSYFSFYPSREGVGKTAKSSFRATSLMGSTRCDLSPSCQRCEIVLYLYFFQMNLEKQQSNHKTQTAAKAGVLSPVLMVTEILFIYKIRYWLWLNCISYITSSQRPHMSFLTFPRWGLDLWMTYWGTFPTRRNSRWLLGIKILFFFLLLGQEWGIADSSRMWMKMSDVNESS